MLEAGDVCLFGRGVCPACAGASRFLNTRENQEGTPWDWAIFLSLNCFYEVMLSVPFCLGNIFIFFLIKETKKILSLERHIQPK